MSTHNSSDQNSWIRLVLKQMSRHTLSIMFVVVVYLLLWVVPQINDLIMVINQADNDWVVVPIFFTILSVFAFLISTVDSYIHPKIPKNIENQLEDHQIESLQDKKQSFLRTPQDEKEIFIKLKNKEGNSIDEGDFQEDTEQYIHRMFPKVLGTVLILIAAFAVNNTYEKVYNGELIITGNWGLLIFIGILFLMLNKRVVDFIIKVFKPITRFKHLPLIVALICLLVIVTFGVLNQGGSERDIQFFFYSLLLLALFFLIITTSYNKYILHLKRYAAVAIAIMTALIFFSYLYLFIIPSGLKVFTPLSIVMICIVGVYTLLNVIRYLGFRYKWLPTLPLFLIILALLAIKTTSQEKFMHYEASSVETSISVENRMELNEYITEWITNRREDILNSSPKNPFPIILVSSEGGGSRAGLWTFLVQSYLFEKNPDYFKKYVFSLSGASGGGVGNNMFYTQAYHILENPNAIGLKYPEGTVPFQYRASKIYNGDYLSSSVASLLGRDSFVSITGFNPTNFQDRGALLEDEWEQSFSNTFEREVDNSLGGAYLQMMPQKGKHKYIRPLLITNTTELQSGQRAIVSPVSMEKDHHNMDVFIDLLGEYPNKDRMIKRSTAMSLNARFPYVSPVGRITGRGQYGDSGYYNNIGGSVTLRLQAALKKELSKDSTLNGKYEIRQLSITNHIIPSKTITYSSQLTAPAGMIASATFAHPIESVKTFSNIYSIQSKLTKIENQDGEFITPFIPLGRYLSRTAVLSMEKRLSEIQKEIDKVIQR